MFAYMLLIRVFTQTIDCGKCQTYVDRTLDFVYMKHLNTPLICPLCVSKKLFNENVGSNRSIFHKTKTEN